MQNRNKTDTQCPCSQLVNHNVSQSKIEIHAAPSIPNSQNLPFSKQFKGFQRNIFTQPTRATNFHPTKSDQIRPNPTNFYPASPQLTSHQSPITIYRLPITDYQSTGLGG